MMKRIFLLLMVSLLLSGASAQTKKTRNTAAMDPSSIMARKISATYTDGLKAYYSGRPNEAMKVFQGIILDNPNHDASYYMMGKIYADQKSYHDAEQALLQAVKLDKKNIWYKIDLADIYMQKGEYAAAAKLWETICKEKNNNEYYLYALSECYLNMQKPEKVISTYSRMEDIIGHNDEITQAKVLLWLYMNKVKEAVGEYDKLIKLFPHDVGNYVKAGRICQSNNMMPQALSYYEKAMELRADDADVCVAMANYWEQQGNRQKQFECLLPFFRNSSADIVKKTAPMHSFVSEAVKNKKQEDIRQAEQLADALMQAHPDMALGYAYKASLNVVQKKYRESMPYFEQALSRDNTVFVVWDDYCYVLKQLDDWTPLLKYEQDIVSLFPNNARLLSGLGLGFLQQKKMDKALEYLNKANVYAYDPELKATIRQAIQTAESGR